MFAPSFYKKINTNVVNVSQISGAVLFNAEFANRKILRLASLDNSDENSLVFFEYKKHLDKLKDIKAAAIFCDDKTVDLIPKNIAILVCVAPYLSFCKTASYLLNSDDIVKSYFSPEANIDKTANIEEGVTIEAGAYIGANVQIGSGTIVKAGAILANNCTVGRNCILGYNTNIQFSMIGNNVFIHSGASIGQDGFGYIMNDSGIEKIPQIGRVIIQDNVEIGANTTIDRGSLDDTIIGFGTKIDNLVQIGHNVTIGSLCLIAAHTGIAGSVSIGNRTALGGGVGIKDHVKIGSNVQIVAASGVMNDISDGEKWGGVPARPVKQWFREVATLRNIVGINK